MPHTNQLLNPKQASEELRKLGLRVSHTTLAKWRSQGGNQPPHYVFGRAIYYCPSELENWVSHRLSKRRHTSQ
ncbi:MAG: helix-turn-helix domain-containing protein, partial [Hyphomonas sp.]|nr:helix-turn-helix domain-containing protein [Hyphomonas sp.]